MQILRELFDYNEHVLHTVASPQTPHVLSDFTAYPALHVVQTVMLEHLAQLVKVA